MRCPSCGYKDTNVMDSRMSSDGASIRRRRKCLKCEERFTTYEYIEQLPLMVVKRDGRRQSFDRTRILNGIMKACEKRPVSIDQIENMVDEIEHNIRKKYDQEINSKDIGEMIMKKLGSLDEVAYVRFASVYRQFRDVNQFMNELQAILGKNKLKIKKKGKRFNMIQMELSRIIIDEKRQDQVVVLKEKSGERQIPIVIGFMEASSIKIKISGVEVPRPMTHDLIVGIIHTLGAKLTQVIIDKLVNNTFYARLEIKTKEGDLKYIDARPSDSIALAVRFKSPIFVSEEVVEQSDATHQ